MKFGEIIGQENVKNMLRSIAERGRIPHALLFCGNEGCGKFALALAFAQYLNCSCRHDGDSCGECLSCRQYASLVHPDLHFVFPYAKNKGKDLCDDFLPEWRQMVSRSPYFNLKQWNNFLAGENKQAVIYSNESEEIARKLSRKSFEAKYTVMLVWLPERMHEACANKLLKLIEEPPADTLFFMVSENPEKLLPTIISRTQAIHVPPIAEADMSEVFSPETARIAQGNFITASELSEDGDGLQAEMTMYRELMLTVFRRDLSGLKMFAEDLAAKGREYSAMFLRYAQRLTRESFVANLCMERLNYMSAGEAEFVSRFRKFVNSGNVERISEIFSDAATDVERNFNAKIVFFDMGLQLMTQIKSA